jgi:hypothetical protein
MSKIRYQVFISSTYSDLQEERLAVSDTIMKMDCIPVGMELFPAIDEDQLAFIKTVIDESDYYVLIIGGRYGSINNEGISFTEREYDYAVEKGIPILSFIHSEPQKIQVGKTDNDPPKALKLQAFIERAKKGRLVKGWRNHSELSLAVTQSLLSQIRVKPGIGWVRGNAVASVELLTEINELRKANAEILKDNDDLKHLSKVTIPNLAPLEQQFKFKAELLHLDGRTVISDMQLKWSDIFSIVGPEYITMGTISQIKLKLENNLFTPIKNNFSYVDILPEYIDTIHVQLLAYGYLAPTGVKGDKLQLTELGSKALFEIKAERAARS